MDETKLLRAAAYVRVSTTMDMQDGSHEVQSDYFENLMKNDPTLKLVGVYGDRKSGREMKKRPEYIYSSDLSQGNFYYLVRQGGIHWWANVRHYIYDILPYFFHEGQ